MYRTELSKYVATCIIFYEGLTLDNFHEGKLVHTEYLNNFCL